MPKKPDPDRQIEAFDLMEEYEEISKKVSEITEMCAQIGMPFIMVFGVTHDGVNGGRAVHYYQGLVQRASLPVEMLIYALETMREKSKPVAVAPQPDHTRRFNQ